VSKADAFLLPANPSLSAITMNGAANRSFLLTGKLASSSPTARMSSKTKAGVWTLDLVDKPLRLNRDAKQSSKPMPWASRSQAMLMFAATQADSRDGHDRQTSLSFGQR
jgi:hypothetical protein